MSTDTATSTVTAMTRSRVGTRCATMTCRKVAGKFRGIAACRPVGSKRVAMTCHSIRVAGFLAPPTPPNLLHRA